jgi:hypothetical protein
MIKLEDIIDHLKKKPKAVYMNDRPPINDNFKFYEVGIQLNFPKYPKRFLNIFHEEDKNMLGIYFRHRIGHEEELHNKHHWITKSEVKGYSIATFEKETLLEDVKNLIDNSYEIVLGTLTKTEQNAVKDLESEENQFFFFDKLAYNFEDVSNYIFVKYQREIEIIKEAKSIIRFEDNMITDMASKEQIKDYTKWEKIIESALSKS